MTADSTWVARPGRRRLRTAVSSLALAFALGGMASGPAAAQSAYGGSSIVINQSVLDSLGPDPNAPGGAGVYGTSPETPHAAPPLPMTGGGAQAAPWSLVVPASPYAGQLAFPPQQQPRSRLLVGPAAAPSPPLPAPPPTAAAAPPRPLVAAQETAQETAAAAPAEAQPEPAPSPAAAPVEPAPSAPAAAEPEPPAEPEAPPALAATPEPTTPDDPDPAEPEAAAEAPAKEPPASEPPAAAEREPEPAAPEPMPAELAEPAPEPEAAPAAAPTAAEPGAGETQTAALPPTADAPPGDLRLEFSGGSTELDAAMRDRLLELARQLRGDEELRIQLVAFATGNGSDASRARRVALSRALAVRSFLLDQGVRSTRMDVRALGHAVTSGPPDRVDIITSRS